MVFDTAKNPVYQTAQTNAPSRKIFRNMFKARWQSMQNVVNDSAFYSLIPEPYITYYLAFIRQWIQWSRGFVPMLHSQDFFSTGMGYTVCDIFSRECMSGGYRLDALDAETKLFINAWATDFGLDNILAKMFFFSNSGGNAILCHTPVRGELLPSVIPIDRIVFETGRRGNITEAMILNRFTAGKTVYYSREFRVMQDGVPYICVELAKGTQSTNPTFGGAALGQVPSDIATQWDRAYGDLLPGVWYEMPALFSTLGLYNVRNKAVAVAIEDMPGYSDSTLHTALDVLYSIDYNYTQAQVDQYLGKSRALIPRQMQTVEILGDRNRVANGLTLPQCIRNQEAPLDDTFYLQVASQSPNGDPIKPTFIQPDLRGEAHRFIRDADLELLASKVGLSSTTLSNHLAYNLSKTATEVRSGQDTTEKSVFAKRELASVALNAFLSDAALFYGFGSAVEIAWGRAGANTSTENAELLTDYQAGTLSLKDYLLKRWPDLSEAEAQEKADELERRNREQAERVNVYNETDYFNGA